MRYLESGLQSRVVTFASNSAKVRTSSKGKYSRRKAGERQIWTSFPVATAMRAPSGLNSTAATRSLKEMRWRRTRRRRLMKRQRLRSSTARRKVASGETAMRATLEEDWMGRVEVSDLRRSVTATRLPTGESSRVLLEITALPPL
ncbi:hypothetical protein V8G54_008617 [Vigna mungo]|uniref:Uncharacterized protein n=1 Tax=Vigna mungo TaxID=3915 RepID=A0AAQ3P5G7_VIGMU